MEDMYRQCTFKHENSITTAWIEEKYAKVGLTMKLALPFYPLLPFNSPSCL
jgi:hypothetical protein